MQQSEDNFEEEEEYEDEEDYEEPPPYREEVYNHIASPIKQFLINYFGDALNDAPAQTFRDIEEQIKDDIFLFAALIPDYLYQYRTITNSKQWDEALANFRRNVHAVFPWPQEGLHWYNRPDRYDEDDDEDEDDMPADAKEVIDAANKLLNDHQKFKTFMQQCCPIIIKETQQFLEKTAVFDLTILSDEGYIVVQKAISQFAEMLAENLHAVTDEL